MTEKRMAELFKKFAPYAIETINGFRGCDGEEETENELLELGFTADEIEFVTNGEIYGTDEAEAQKDKIHIVAQNIATKEVCGIITLQKNDAIKFRVITAAEREKMGMGEDYNINNLLCRVKDVDFDYEPDTEVLCPKETFEKADIPNKDKKQKKIHIVIKDALVDSVRGLVTLSKKDYNRFKETVETLKEELNKEFDLGWNVEDLIDKIDDIDFIYESDPEVLYI